MPEEQAYYLLVNISAGSGAATTHLPLNLCLVLDRSNSMQGARLQAVKAAIHQIIDNLQPDDTLSLVVFNNRPRVVLSGQFLGDKTHAKSIVSTIQAGGGTEILPGLSAGLEQIARHRSPSSVNQLILLTDGQTYGDEATCVEQARRAGAQQINISTIGIGLDWNENLLDQIAAASSGFSVYIDSPEKVRNVFTETMRNLQQVVFRELLMVVRSDSRLRLHEAFLVAPQIERLPVHMGQLKLGPLSAEQEKRLLLEFRVKDPPPGGECRAGLKVQVDNSSAALNGKSWVIREVGVEFSPPPLPDRPIPPSITRALGKLAVFKMQEKVMTDLESDRRDQATRRLEMMATQLLNLGEVNLARAALTEARQIQQTGYISAEGRKKIHYGTRALSTGALARRERLATIALPIPAKSSRTG